MIDGYLMQSHEVAIAIEGVFRRAVKENVSLIIEGVHLAPALQRRLARGAGPVVVPFVLAALKKKRLRRQLVGRGLQVPGRKARPYLDHFDEIWHLQTFLLSEADRYDIPIVQNTSVEDSVRQVMQTVSDALSERYSADPADAFPG
jgi:2-phosphoglycerate kinase